MIGASSGLGPFGSTGLAGTGATGTPGGGGNGWKGSIGSSGTGTPGMGRGAESCAHAALPPPNTANQTSMHAHHSLRWLERPMRVLKAAAEAIRTGRAAALVVVVEERGSTPRSRGSRMLVYGDGSLVGTIGGGAIEHQVVQEALRVLTLGAPATYHAHLTRDLGMCCGGEMSVYIEPLEHRPTLTIYGAGHVAEALAPIAVALEFDVQVVDERDALIERSAFDGTDRHTDNPVAHAASLENGYALIVTHDHALDQELVSRLLPKESLAWVGMIGSRAKVTRFLVRLKASGATEQQLRRLCAPVGLDLGAETPSEIAVAIAAELVRVRRHADRTPLPLSAEPIAARGGDALPGAWLRE